MNNSLLGRIPGVAYRGNDTLFLDKTLGQIFPENSKLEEEPSIGSLPSIKNSHFKKKATPEPEAKLESIDERRGMANEYVSVENEVDRIINQDLEQIDKEQRGGPSQQKRVRGKYSESFFVGGGLRKKKDDGRSDLGSLNMRSFQYDKEDLEKRTYMARLMEMREENERLKRENEEMRGREAEKTRKEKEREKGAKVALESLTKSGRKSGKKALLKKMNLSLMSLKKDLDQSNLEISFLENKGGTGKAKTERAKLRRDKLRKEARRKKKGEGFANFMRDDIDRPVRVEDFKLKFRKKESAEAVTEPTESDTQKEEPDLQNESMESTRSRFDELREKRRRSEMQKETEEESQQSRSICREEGEAEKLRQEIVEGEKREFQLEREKSDLLTQLEGARERNRELLVRVEELSRKLEQTSKEKTFEKSFNEGRRSPS